MSRPRHEQLDPVDAGGGLELVVCRCGWRSDPVPAPDWTALDEAYDAAWDAQHTAWRAHYGPLVTPDPSQRLDLRRDTWGGWRHHLADEAVHAGEGLDLLLPDGIWWSGRYESAWPPGARDTTGPVAMFHAGLGGPWLANDTEHTVQVSFPLPSEAVLRWPHDRWQRW